MPRSTLINALALVLTLVFCCVPRAAWARDFGDCTLPGYLEQYDDRLTTPIACHEFRQFPIHGTLMRIISAAPGTALPYAAFDTDVEALAEQVSTAMDEFGGRLNINEVSLLVTDLPPPASGPHPFVVAIAQGLGECHITYYSTAGRARDPDFARFVVAHELFHCIQNETWSTHDRQSEALWWLEGSAEYFANYVVPHMEFSRGAIDNFESGRPNSILGFDYPTVVFFSWLGQTRPGSGIYDVLNATPLDGDRSASSQATHLRAQVPLDDWVAFEEAYLDQTIQLPRGDLILNHPSPGPLDVVVGDDTIPYFAEPFTVKAAQIAFAAGAVYTIDFLDTQPRLKMQWSENGGAWQDPPRRVSTCDGERQFRIVLGRVQGNGTMRVRIHREEDERACCPPGSSDLAECPDAGTGDGGEGGGYGEPHIYTFDKYEYGFQAVGEFVFTRSQNGFEVQTRQERIPGVVNGQQVSVNTAAALRIGSHRVAFYAHRFDGVSISASRVYIDGRPTKVDDSGVTVGDARIAARGDNAYDVVFSSGHLVGIDFFDWNGLGYLDLNVKIPPTGRGAYGGLLGNFDGKSDNDLRVQGGDVIPADRSSYDKVSSIVRDSVPAPIPLDALGNAYYEKLYRSFGDSWRVTAANSLFDYGRGQSTATFTDKSFPSKFASLQSLDQQAVSRAEATCQAAGVKPETMNGCIFDVAITGDSGFANSLVQLATDRLKQRAIDELRNRLPEIPGVPGIPSIPGVPGLPGIPGLP